MFNKILFWIHHHASHAKHTNLLENKILIYVLDILEIMFFFLMFISEISVCLSDSLVALGG